MLCDEESCIGVGDFNGDGDLDLLIVNTQTPYVALLLGDGHGSFYPAPHSPFTTNVKPHPHGVAVGHFCGDEEPLDAVIDSWGSGEVELLLGDGKGNLRNGPKFPAGRGSEYAAADRRLQSGWKTRYRDGELAYRTYRTRSSRRGDRVINSIRSCININCNTVPVLTKEWDCPDFRRSQMSSQSLALRP